MPSQITNWGLAALASLVGAMSGILAFIPRLVGFIVILIIGWIVAALIKKGVTLLLRKIGFDEFSDRLGMARVEERMGTRIDMPNVLGTIAFWFVFLIFVIPAINALNVPAVSAILSQIIAYIPNVFVAAIALFLGLLVGNFVGDLVERAVPSGQFGNPRILGNIARAVIIGFAVIIALAQLNITPQLFQILFSAFVGAAALAAGLAFGLGGKDTVQRWLARNEERMVQNRGGTPLNPVPQPTEHPTRKAGSRSDQYRSA